MNKTIDDLFTIPFFYTLCYTKGTYTFLTLIW